MGLAISSASGYLLSTQISKLCNAFDVVFCLHGTGMDLRDYSFQIRCSIRKEEYQKDAVQNEANKFYLVLNSAISLTFGQFCSKLDNQINVAQSNK